MSDLAWAWAGCAGWFLVAMIQQYEIQQLRKRVALMGEITLSVLNKGLKP